MQHWQPHPAQLLLRIYNRGTGSGLAGFYCSTEDHHLRQQLQPLEHTLSHFGVSTTFVDAHNLEAVESAIQENTRAIYLETRSE